MDNKAIVIGLGVWMLFGTGIVILSLIIPGHLQSSTSKQRYDSDITLSDELIAEIGAHRDDVQRIIQYVLEGEGKHVAYRRLAELTDTFGHRKSGSEELERSIDYLLEKMSAEGLENVHGENATVPDWTRGEEHVIMLEPRFHIMSVLGLGFSEGTGGQNITGEVIVVRSFEELHQRAHEVPDKIVVYNQPYDGYGTAVQYRSSGASWASNYGAKAALIRSITGYSIYSPHTGTQTYWQNVTKIPGLCITVEDAELLQRIHDRGVSITVSIQSTSTNTPDITSRNLVADVRGSELPEQLVTFGGHIDSWDVGTGPMDDAGGVVISWMVLSIIKNLGLSPKRTMRAVGWTAEEIGAYGGRAYFWDHQDDVNLTSFILESDSGLWTPTGISFTGTDYARAIITEIIKLLSDIDATTVGPWGGGADIQEWGNVGVPMGSINLKDSEEYFHFHHSEGDTMTMMNADQIDLCTITWAATTYVVANLQDMLPREGVEPPPVGTATWLHTTWQFIYCTVFVVITHIIY